MTTCPIQRYILHLSPVPLSFAPPPSSETISHTNEPLKPYGEWMIVKSKKPSKPSRPTITPADQKSSSFSQPHAQTTTHAHPLTRVTSCDPSTLSPSSRDRTSKDAPLSIHTRKNPTSFDNDLSSDQHAKTPQPSTDLTHSTRSIPSSPKPNGKPTHLNETRKSQAYKPSCSANLPSLKPRTTYHIPIPPTTLKTPSHTPSLTLPF